MNRRLRVLQINGAFDRGAPAQGAAALARCLNPNEFQVVAVSLRAQPDSHSPTATDLHSAGIKHISLGMKGFLDGRVLPKLVRLMQDFQPDIVHTHALRADLWAGLAVKLARVPLFVTSIRNNEWECFRTEQPFPVAQMAMAMSKLSTSLADALIAVSEGVKGHLMNVQKISPAKVRVIPNGVDLERLARPRRQPMMIRGDLHVPPDAVLVGTLAIFKPRKGLSYLVEAAREVLTRYPQVYFLLAGEGPDHQVIEQQVKRLGLENRVCLLGHRSDALAILDALDIYVLPSLFEGFPRSILEAMALGKPVVATDIGGSREAVEHDQSGIIVPPRDAEALARAICRLIESPSLRKAMGEVGRHRVQEHFNARVNAQAHEAIYRELLQAKGYSSLQYADERLFRTKHGK